jgi:HEPN domain-containing protein
MNELKGLCMSGNQHEALRWLKQAEKDLSSARNSLDSGDYEWACFQSQQSAEKALKALLYLHGYRKILTHSIFELVKEVGGSEREFMRLTRQAKVLDGVYISSRYPNGIAGDLVPGEYYEQEDAEECISCAGLILAEVKNYIES